MLSKLINIFIECFPRIIATYFMVILIYMFRVKNQFPFVCQLIFPDSVKSQIMPRNIPKFIQPESSHTILFQQVIDICMLFKCFDIQSSDPFYAVQFFLHFSLLCWFI